MVIIWRVFFLLQFPPVTFPKSTALDLCFFFSHARTYTCLFFCYNSYRSHSQNPLELFFSHARPVLSCPSSILEEQWNVYLSVFILRRNSFFLIWTKKLIIGTIWLFLNTYVNTSSGVGVDGWSKFQAGADLSRSNWAEVQYMCLLHQDVSNDQASDLNDKGIMYYREAYSLQMFLTNWAIKMLSNSFWRRLVGVLGGQQRCSELHLPKGVPKRRV